jgi:hypothetical protein
MFSNHLCKMKQIILFLHHTIDIKYIFVIFSQCVISMFLCTSWWSVVTFLMVVRWKFMNTYASVYWLTTDSQGYQFHLPPHVFLSARVAFWSLLWGSEGFKLVLQPSPLIFCICSYSESVWLFSAFRILTTSV